MTFSHLVLRDPAVLSYGLCALAFLAFVVHLAFGWRGGPKATVLVAAVAMTGAWAALNVAFALTQAAPLWRAQALLDALRVAAWVVFLALILGGGRRALVWCAGLLVLPAVALGLPPPGPETDGFAVTRAAVGALLAVTVAGLVLIEQVFRRAREHARWSIKPLCLGLGGLFVFDLYLYADALLFSRIGADVWAARGLAHALVIPFLAIATARNRDWTIDIALSRAVVFQSATFLATGIYLLTIAAAGYYVRYFGGSWGKTVQIGFIFAALLILGWLFSSGTLRSKVRVFINKNFFSYRYDYREEWLRFTNVLFSRDRSVSAAQRSVEALANLVESPAGALWLLNDDGDFVQEARWNFPGLHAAEPADGAFAQFLRRTGWVVNLAESIDEPSRYPDLTVPEWIRALPSAWLVVPIIAEDELIGFGVLATPRTSLDVDWEVRDLLKSAARQAGSFLAQLRTSEALLEARKFEAFNKMTAFVVHDLKNLVAQLGLLMKNAERHAQNPRFQTDMLSTVQHVSDRMNRLLLQLSAGARGDEGARPVNLARLAERVTQTRRGENTHLLVHAPDPVITVGQEARLERVLGHLMQNAIDATRERGEVEIRVFAEGRRAIVEVKDNGCGMSEEFVRERLFRPFQTTKPAGMGIGAFETAQLAKDMGGSIQADSRPGAGTLIRLVLPLHAEEQRDEQKAQALA
jgi:putative PEP-CTERM system histidine kinase